MNLIWTCVYSLTCDGSAYRGHAVGEESAVPRGHALNDYIAIGKVQFDTIATPAGLVCRDQRGAVDA